MAAIPVVLNGTFTTDSGSQAGTFVGQMAYSDRGVGGGPVFPPSGGDEHPEHPIYYPPGTRPHPEHPIAGLDPHPEHPIVIPDPPTEPPTNPPDAQGWVKPPPEGGWGYHETYQWLYNPAPGEMGPK